ncbi:MAG: Lrp/AsnC family transcriptional regulator [Candidatus Woesearchaeota archaeon]
MKLDHKDYKLLQLLDANARTPLSQIAKKIGVSPEVAHYRLKRLEEEQIITQYQVIINLSALHITQFKICLALEQLISAQLEIIIKTLKEKSSIKWIVTCKGNWDIIIAIESEDMIKGDVIKDEVLALFQGHIRKKAITILIEAQTFNRDYLTGQKTVIHDTRSITANKQEIIIDDKDHQIIKLLAENARASVVDIAKKLRIDSRVVIYHIRKLEKNKIILGYKIALNYAKLNIQFHKLFIELNGTDTSQSKALTNYLKIHPNCIHHVKVFGSWELEPEFETATEQEFENILRELKDKFTSIIKKIDVITIAKEHKFVYF